MIVRFAKQLIQSDFLERGHAQDLQQLVERELQVHPFPDDRDEGADCDGRPDLRSHRVLRCGLYVSRAPPLASNLKKYFIFIAKTKIERKKQ